MMTSPSESDGPSLSYGAVAALLGLSELRSRAVVSQALLARFPDEDAWYRGLLQDPLTTETLNAFAEVSGDIVRELDEADSPEATAAVVARHRERLEESVDWLAERIGVSSADLLTVLANV